MLPRYIGALQGDWQSLCKGKLGEWFAELAELGLTPVESGWLPSLLVNEKTARALVSLRVSQLHEWSGGHCPWLVAARPNVRARPIRRVSATGDVERFASVSEAVRVTSTIAFA